MSISNVNSTVPSPDDQDLDWQAFRYISGEMSADELAAFERLLGVDQSAREAVARSVELLGQMSTVPGSTVETVRPNRHPKIFAAVMTVAALIVVCLSFATFREAPTDEPGRTLIALWSEPRDPDLLNDEPDDESDDELAAVDGADADGLTVPGWLVAALESSSDDTSEEE